MIPQTQGAKMLTVIKCDFRRKGNTEDAQHHQLAVLASIVFHNNDKGVNKNMSEKLCTRVCIQYMVYLGTQRVQKEK